MCVATEQCDLVPPPRSTCCDNIYRHRLDKKEFEKGLNKKDESSTHPLKDETEKV
jgi:hypothetical protein